MERWIKFDDVALRRLINNMNKLDTEVVIYFKKANDEEREMVVNRYQADEIDNSPEAINREIERGTITVFDEGIGEIRRFNKDRLFAYSVMREGIKIDYKIEGRADKENKKADTVRERSDIGGHEEVLNSLRNNVVRLVFEKKDGSSRVMYATRNGNLISEFTGETIEPDVDMEREERAIDEFYNDVVKVYDVGAKGWRSFKPSNLLKEDSYANVSSWIEFKPNSEEWRKLIEGEIQITDVVKPNRKETTNTNTSPHLRETDRTDGTFTDPKRLDGSEVLNMLSNHVVRLVFRKADGSRRVMYATRNHELIKKYLGEQKATARAGNDPMSEFNRDFVKVFDVENLEWKTFKPSTLYDYDTENNVSSFVAFDIQDDAWFEVMRNNIDVRLVASNTLVGKKIGTGISQGRPFFEREHSFPVIDKNLVNSAKTGLVLISLRDGNKIYATGNENLVDVLGGSYTHDDYSITVFDVKAQEWVTLESAEIVDFVPNKSFQNNVAKFDNGSVFDFNSRDDSVSHTVENTVADDDDDDEEYGDYDTDISEDEIVETESKNEFNALTHIDINTLDMYQLVQDMEKYVVHLSFKKADGTTRRMIGTRNPEVIALYMPEEHMTFDMHEKIASHLSSPIGEVDKDVVSVFDLSILEWRKFKPSKVLSYDTEKNIGSWIQFKPEEIGWVNVAIGEESIEKFYKVGDLNAVPSATNVKSKKVFEDSQREAFKRVLAQHANEPEVDTSQFTDPKTLNAKKILDSLSKNVVRLVFKKKDSDEVRVLIGTRNTKLIPLYDKGFKIEKTEETRNLLSNGLDEFERDYVKVLDLEKQEWRTFKPSLLLDYDTENLVSSWLEFNPKDDNWYELVNGSANVKDLTANKKFKTKTIGNVSSGRATFELERKRELAIQQYNEEQKQKQLASAPAINEERENRKERLVATVNAMKSNFFAQGLGNTINPANDAIYTKLLEKAEGFRDFLYDLQREGKGRGAIERIEGNKKLNTVIVKFDDGEVLYMNPNFIINGVSHKVYFEKGASFGLGRPISSETDTEFANDIMRHFVPILQTGRGRKAVEVESRKLTPEDEARLDRAVAYNQKNRQKLQKESVAIACVPASETESKYILIKAGNRVFKFNTNYFKDAQNDTFFYTNKEATFRLNNFLDAIGKYKDFGSTAEVEKEKALAMKLGITVEQFRLVKEIIHKTLNRHERL